MTKAYKRWVMAIVIILGLIALLSGGKTLYFFFISAIVIRLGAFAMIRHNNKNVFVQFFSNDTIVESGDPINIEYKVSNTSILPITHAYIKFELDERMSAHTSLHEVAYISGQDTLPFNKEMVCKYRGYYKLGEVSVKLFDPLMLEEKTHLFTKTVDITVHPKVFPIQVLKVDPKELFGTLKSDKRTLFDHTNLINIRKYEKGDSLKNIHWKLSAKRDQLFTKEYQETITSKQIVIMDGSVQGFIDYDREETMVSFCASIVDYILSENIEMRLMLNDGARTFVDGRDRTDFPKVLEILTQFESKSDESLPNFLKQVIGNGENIVLITSRLSEEVIDFINAHNGQVSIYTYFDKNIPMTKHSIGYMDKIMEVQYEKV